MKKNVKVALDSDSREPKRDRKKVLELTPEDLKLVVGGGARHRRVT